MARKCKPRIVCKEPKFRLFTTNNDEHSEVILTVDEYETIRCIDLEKMTQDECARLMGVARTTVQAMYDIARFKISLMIVNGYSLKIEGGEYIVCDGHNKGCIHRNLCKKLQGGKRMKIAVTYENGEIFQHFGHSEHFELFEVEDGKIISSEVVDTNGQGHGALAGFLKERTIDVLICGGIGGGAVSALTEAGIKLVSGMSGNTKEAVNKFLKNELPINQASNCDHHHEGEEHECHCGDHHHDHEDHECHCGEHHHDHHGGCGCK